MAEKTRIAILGSGPAALGTAWEITESPNWSDRFEIDFYVMGWRLGGKTASGRDPEHRFRNLEHGLHILGGYYHNSFQQFRPLYQAWAQQEANHPIPFDQAFFKHRTFSLMQREPDKVWRQVRVNFPTNDLEPGVDPIIIHPKTVIRRLLEWLGKSVSKLAAGQVPENWFEDAGSNGQNEQTGKAGAVFGDDTANAKMGAAAATLDRLINLANLAQDLADPFAAPAAAAAIVQALDDMLERLKAMDDELPLVQNVDWWGLIGLVTACVRGMSADRVYELGYDAINDKEARAWLEWHGASPRALRNSIFECCYHYAFAFRDGDTSKPDIAAGAILRGLVRMAFGSHGTLFYHMNGGMGEVVALPYYDVLKARGVRFHFFHKVTNLTPDNAGNLGTIAFEVQAAVHDGHAPYEPIIEYVPAGQETPRRTWPSRPLYDQLSNGGALSAEGIDLESWFSPPPPGAVDKHISFGKDFDLCVLSIPPAMLKHIAQPLMQDNNRWRMMIESAGASPTIAAQSWTQQETATYEGLSGDGLLTGYEYPLDTWCDMSFLLPFEQPGDKGDRPTSLSYFCGPVSFAGGSNAPLDEQRRSEQLTQRWYTSHLPQAFPGFRSGDEVERISLINSDPAKLYVTSPAGSIDHRFWPDDTGYGNLRVAGDWTRSNFDAGAVEGAIQSARLCSRSICGYPKQIFWESDLV